MFFPRSLEKKGLPRRPHFVDLSSVIYTVWCWEEKGNREEKGRNRGKDEGHVRWDQQRSSRKGSGASEAKGVCREC